MIATPAPKRALLLLAVLFGLLLITALVAIGITPTQDTWIRAAEASIRQNDFAAALNSVNHALAVEPDNPSLLRLRGRVFVYLYEWDRALADYNRALELAPTDPALFYDRAILFYTRLQLDRALADFQQVITISPSAPLSTRAAAYITAIKTQQAALNNP
jgi:tetratricopeptide (TPR) repeat protein